MSPKISTYSKYDCPASAIRVASQLFAERSDVNDVRALRTDIGNVSRPMHPVLQEKLRKLGLPGGDFADGRVMYTPSTGIPECQDTFRHIIKASGFDSGDLYVHVTDGGSFAMQSIVLGTCGPAGTDEDPLMVIDPAYTNYAAMARRTGRAITSIQRTLQLDGKFTLPTIEEIDSAITEKKPNALVVIPYDNPTGHFYNQKDLNDLAKLCVKHDIWMVSDEAYRELQYTDQPTSSIWGITEEDVPGISGRRISVETGSKVWNACGLHIGALVTDSEEFYVPSVNDSNANLCPNALSQAIFSEIRNIPIPELQAWFKKQRDEYKPMMTDFTHELRKRIPGVIVSSPDASIYSVVDMREVDSSFDAYNFMLFCAKTGVATLENEKLTMLTSPMAGFYTMPDGEVNPGKTQMRIAYVPSEEDMKMAPELLSELLKLYKHEQSSH